jgi:hypothetical protein
LGALLRDRSNEAGMLSINNTFNRAEVMRPLLYDDGVAQDPDFRYFDVDYVAVIELGLMAAGARENHITRAQRHPLADIADAGGGVVNNIRRFYVLDLLSVYPGEDLDVVGV